MLRGVFTDVSGQPIGPIFNAQAVQEEIFSVDWYLPKFEENLSVPLRQ
jgi:hypothetical protein